VDGPQVLLRPNDAQTVAIILHELATNAAKYGALSAPNGQVHLQWLHHADGQLVLTWTEVGGPPVRTPSRQGFGSRIIAQLIDQQQGQTQFDWRPAGLVCEITFQA
jgi:two-component sensor histidine kinase